MHVFRIHYDMVAISVQHKHSFSVLITAQLPQEHHEMSTSRSLLLAGDPSLSFDSLRSPSMGSPGL